MTVHRKDREPSYGALGTLFQATITGDRVALEGPLKKQPSAVRPLIQIVMSLAEFEREWVEYAPEGTANT